MNKNDKIYIAGHTGLVGSAILTKLQKDGFKNIITRTSSELDLTNQQAVKSFFEIEKPDYVFLMAAKVGGILANEAQPVDFIYPNLLIECNVINSAKETNVKKLLFLACGCVYPKESNQPIKEEYLLESKPEPTNLSHTIAKVAGIVLCQSYNKQFKTNFISCVSSNIFGPNDNFDLTASHVVAALIRKIHTAKIKNEDRVVLWGTGKPLRDFIYVDDVADACLFLIEKYNLSEIINISIGLDMSIREMAEQIKDVLEFKGKIEFDTTKPDGMPKKLLDNTRITSLGWKPKGSIKEGLKKTYTWYLSSNENNNN